MTRIAVLVTSFFVTFALLSGAYATGRAHADTMPAPVLLAQANIPADASAPNTSAPANDATPEPTPADQLHDPLAAPQATFNDVKQAKRQGWAVLAFAIGVIVSRLLGRAKSIKWLAWLGKGRAAVIVGGFSALAVAGYNAVADGGSWYAALLAGAMAVAAWWPSHAKAPASEPAAA